MSRWHLIFGLATSLYASSPAKPATTPHQQQNQPAKKNEVFKSFTGKVAANKVRLRVKPDLDSPIFKQIDKNELLLVVGEVGDFYAVEPPKGTKAFIFRSYVLDDRVEANRVNVRLEPNIDAPIIGQLKAGDVVKGTVCKTNHKWLEIQAPKGSHFFVAKEYLTSAGGPELLAATEKRKSQVDELLTSAFSFAESECKKSYDQMEVKEATEKFQAILKNYPDFPEATRQAKEGLALLKETYLNKKISFLEAKSELSPEAKEELLLKHKKETLELTPQVDPLLWSRKNAEKEQAHSTSHAWDALEESLYLSWTAFHSGKKIDDFYLEQKINAVHLSGKIETYYDTIRDKPGDFLLSLPDGTYAYLYSTRLDLSQHVGQTVMLEASPRPNNHFAFPAYFVLKVEEMN